ncbi:MAG: ferric reductase-like transmembrane domain-containing protein [Pseudomonadota bacterium]
MSPLLAWREPIYILACFAGIIGLALLFLQPLMIGGYLPGVPARLRNTLHALIGFLVLASVLIHVGGLYITSPPDVMDALFLRSPTPFSIWGVMAMWAVLTTALLAAFRSRWRLPNLIWRAAHASLAIVIVAGTVAHALLIEGTMGTLSKIALCALVLAATFKVIADRRTWSVVFRRRHAGR